MTACVNCTRTLQPAWKYCIFCGTRTTVAATASRSRPLPKRTPVPGYASVSTSQTPIVAPAAPAPLSAAPSDEPVSSLWPESMGERPSLRAAIAAVEVPAPTPPVHEGDAPEAEPDAVETGTVDAPDEVDEVEDDVEVDEPIDDDVSSVGRMSIADLVEADVEAADAEPDAQAGSEPDAVADPETDADAEPETEPEPETDARSARPRLRNPFRRSSSPAGTLLEEAPAVVTATDDEPGTDAGSDMDTDPDTEPDLDADLEADDEPLTEPAPDDAEAPLPRRKVNTLAVLALLIGILACPLAALFGHLALSQLKVSDERGVIPAWAAVVLGYLWLGFWIVFGISYFATNG